MSVNLYASREGALYQSYDNYAGASGFYDPSQDAAQQPDSSDPAQVQARFLACDAQRFPRACAGIHGRDACLRRGGVRCGACGPAPDVRWEL